MRDIVKEGRLCRMRFILGGENSLGNISTTSGFGAGVVGRPSLDGDGNDEQGDPGVLR